MAKLSPHQVNALVVKSVFRDVNIIGGDGIFGGQYVTISEGTTVGSDDGAVVMVAGSDIVIDHNASGAGGIDNGIPPVSNEWHYIWMIYNPATEDINAMTSASVDSPLMPSGYTSKRLVGAVWTSPTQYSGFYQRDLDVGHSPRTIASGISAPGSLTPFSIVNVVPHLITNAVRTRIDVDSTSASPRVFLSTNGVHNMSTLHANALESSISNYRLDGTFGTHVLWNEYLYIYSTEPTNDDIDYWAIYSHTLRL